MAFQFNPGCNCCGPGEVCLIHNETWPYGTSPSDLPSEWQVYSGTWEIPAPFGFVVQTTSDNALIAFFPQPEDAYHIRATITSDTPQQTSGYVVAFLDTSNYIYVKILWPRGDLVPANRVNGSISIIHISGGTETVVQTPYVIIADDFSIASAQYDICLIEGQNGNLPVVQVATGASTSVIIHACVPSFPGTGYGLRTDSLLGGAFSGLGEYTSYHNWRADSSQAAGLETGITSCECQCQCQNCDDTAQITELAVDIVGFTGFDDACLDVCTELNGSYIARCVGEIVGSSPEGGFGATWGTGLVCQWRVFFTPVVTLHELIISLYRVLNTDPWTLEARVEGCGGVQIVGKRNVGYSKLTMDGLTQMIAAGDTWTEYDAVDSPGICWDHSVTTTPGTITISGVAIEGCP